MRLIVPMAALLLVVLAGCGGESTADPSPTATFAPSPTPSPTFTQTAVAVTTRSRFTPEQETCLAEAIGERAARELSAGERQPSPNELDAINDCVIPVPVAVEEWKGLTPEQEACLVEAIGEQAVREAKTGQNPPTADELDALVACGIFEPQPDFDLLPEASAPAGLSTVAWPNDIQESSALFERLPSEISGHRIRARFEQVGLGVFSTTYEEDAETPNKVMAVTVHDLTAGAFFPPDTNAGQFVALYASGSELRVLAAGREGDLAWVQWKISGIYTMHWGNAPSSVVFQAMATDPLELIALVEAMISAASG